MAWPHHKLKLVLDDEQRSIADSFPTLSLSIRSRGYVITSRLELALDSALVEGAVLVPNAGVSYDVAIILSRQHPKHLPVLVCRDPAIPSVSDRHINWDDTACLCARAESKKYYPPGSGLVHFLENLVVPFLTAQFYFTAHGSWPWPERGHGAKGILEAYDGILGTSDGHVIASFLQSRLFKKRPGGHTSCPCGSGLTLRHCHAAEMWALWDSVSQEDAAHDLADLRRSVGENLGLARRIDLKKRFGLEVKVSS